MCLSTIIEHKNESVAKCSRFICYLKCNAIAHICNDTREAVTYIFIHSYIRLCTVRVAKTYTRTLIHSGTLYTARAWLLIALLNPHSRDIPVVTALAEL